MFKFAVLVFGLAGSLTLSPRTVAAAAPDYICVSDVTPNALQATNLYVFPNWTKTHLTTFDVWVCDTALCTWGSAPENLTGVTIQNFGTATTADFTDVYWRVNCSVDTGYITMTYAGLWDAGLPTWTWAGTSIDISDCGPAFPLQIYADMDPCPTDGATINFAVRADAGLNPAWPGGVTDVHGCAAPYNNVLSAIPKTIAYVVTERDRKTAAPGDTTTHTIYYGMPGTSPLNPVVITDSLPAYTHYVPGSASPPPDPGWDPDSGPPIRLRWTFPGPLTPGAGPTQAITFQTTVDWGNCGGLCIEPLSGNVAAPEGTRLRNRAHANFQGSSCSADGYVSNTRDVVVERFLMYMLGDNDVLYAGRVGQPDDEVIYSIFIKNVSATKTWWNVNIWDTVPSELEVWTSGFGHQDPCLGWTITPSGCAAANAGRTVSGPNTILTWSLDLPPGETIELKWKAHVKATNAIPGDTAINRLSVLAYGAVDIIGGTGHSGVPKRFNHVAPIVLRTMYISYLGVGGGGLGQSGVALTFYPLHKAANFELRGIEYDGATTYPWQGGVSASIGQYMGDCLTGFWCAGSNGCGPPRAPAHYSRYTAGCFPDSGSGSPAQPFHSIYKVVANAPVLWQMFSTLHSDDHDSHTFTPSTSLGFSGFIHYMFLRDNNSANRGDALNIMNTSIDSFSTYDSTLATTIHIFKWNPTVMQYEHLEYHDLDADSQWAKPPLPGAAQRGFYMVVSSDARLVVRQQAMCYGVIQGGAYNNYGTLAPTRETGTLVSTGAGQTFYIFPGSRARESSVIVGNVGTVPVTFRIEKYIPREPTDRPGSVPLWMGGTSGIWDFVKRDTVAADGAWPAVTTNSSHIYGVSYDSSYTFQTPDTRAGIWRIIQESPGSIQVQNGIRVLSVYSGGGLLHAADPPGANVGKQFWLHSGWNWSNNTSSHCDLAAQGAIFTVDFFCPKPGMILHTVSSDGYTSTYTSDGPDQCIAIKSLTDVAQGSKRNVRFRLDPGGAQGNLIAMYNHCQPSHKFFTAPFLETGVHYDIIAPPFAYVGQNFWITVIVVEAAGDTKLDYCGTTSFTSTDPGAKIETQNMGSYTYPWDSDDVGAVCKGAGCVDNCDNGVAIFVNVSLSQLGPQTIVASDLVDGSILGLTTVIVVGVDVKLTKEPRLAVAASGDTVQFRVCWSNYSSSTAFDFVVTDGIPLGTSYVSDTAAAMVCGVPAGVTVDVTYSTETTSPPVTFTSAGGGPPANTTWLRWTVRDVGVRTTGCLCYRVKVN